MCAAIQKSRSPETCNSWLTRQMMKMKPAIAVFLLSTCCVLYHLVWLSIQVTQAGEVIGPFLLAQHYPSSHYILNNLVLFYIDRNIDHIRHTETHALYIFFHLVQSCRSNGRVREFRSFNKKTLHWFWPVAVSVSEMLLVKRYPQCLVLIMYIALCIFVPW